MHITRGQLESVQCGEAHNGQRGLMQSTCIMEFHSEPARLGPLPNLVLTVKKLSVPAN